MIELFTQLLGLGGIGPRELALADTGKDKIESGASEVGDAQLRQTNVSIERRLIIL